jgi:hypothetical protein
MSYLRKCRIHERRRVNPNSPNPYVRRKDPCLVPTTTWGDPPPSIEGVCLLRPHGHHATRTFALGDRCPVPSTFVLRPCLPRVACLAIVFGPSTTPHGAQAPATYTPPRVMRPHIGILSSILLRDDKHATGKEGGGGLERGESSGREGDDQWRRCQEREGPWRWRHTSSSSLIHRTPASPSSNSTRYVSPSNHQTSLSFALCTHVVIFTCG